MINIQVVKMFRHNASVIDEQTNGQNGRSVYRFICMNSSRGKKRLPI